MGLSAAQNLTHTANYYKELSELSVKERNTILSVVHLEITSIYYQVTKMDRRHHHSNRSRLSINTTKDTSMFDSQSGYSTAYTIAFHGRESENESTGEGSSLFIRRSTSRGRQDRREKRKEREEKRNNNRGEIEEADRHTEGGRGVCQSEKRRR
jgi:hypothetical protein